MAADEGLSPAKKNGKMPLVALFKETRNVCKRDELGLEIIQIAVPATLALAADPVASLIDTAFIGRIGPVELAVGVSVAIFNQVSRITMFPLVGVTISFVAEEDATSCSCTETDKNKELEMGCASDSKMEKLINQAGCNESNDARKAKMEHERRHIPSASSALFIGSILGIIQTLFLILTAKPLLGYMGLYSESPMLKPAERYLTLRSLCAPAILLSLAMQGIFQGFKDAKTPLYAAIVGDATNVVLDPIFIFMLRLGVNGAAIAHVISQYVIAFMLFRGLSTQVDLLPPSFKDTQHRRFLENGLLLLVKVIAATFCVTVAASLAARQGPISMAAFQVCLQMWLATSLLADGLAIAGQAILASSFAKKDYEKALTTASWLLQFALVLGLVLSAILSVVLPFSARLFTKDIGVLQLISLGIPFVVASQPINALAFAFDGVNYGASDFTYSALSMVLVAIVSIVCLFVLSFSHGYGGIWIALCIYMSLRIFAGLLRIGSGSGPWHFLRG